MKKPKSFDDETEMALATDHELRENVEVIFDAVDTVDILFKRIILACVIAFLIFLTVFDFLIIFQTIKAIGYTETTATFVSKTEDPSSKLTNYIYTYKDKKGVEYSADISTSLLLDEKIKIKYNKKNPEQFYSPGGLMDVGKLIWFIVKLVAIVLLILLFFNKEELRKIHMRVRS